MIDLGPHASYILTAYGGVLVVTLALIGVTIANARRENFKLVELEAAGLRRGRSAAKKAGKSS